MSEAIVAKRYAKAIFELASEQNILPKLEQDLLVIHQTVKGTKDFSQLLSAPSIDKATKKKLLKDAFKDMHPYSQNLLFLLVDRNRFSLLADIYHAFHQMVMEAKGQVEAWVTSAFPLSDEDRQALLTVFEQRTNKKISMHTQVDSDLLGGVVVRIGNRVYDGSLATQLKRFHENLTRLG
jgi:F-type H+-transporting ATPase subunit delta